MTQLQRLTKTPLQMYSIPEIASATRDWWFFPPILLSVAANVRNPQAFITQISREMTYPARPLPVLPSASAAVITAQIEAGQQIAYERQSVAQAVDAFMSTARKAIATK